jgi:glycosyltransferase involved in cell wall biosynthesis
MPAISVITASFNKESYISETIQSVLSQTYINWELIIVDDCSSDRTIELVNRFKTQDDRIKLILNTVNSGANFCRNYGLSIAKGEYVIFLDADDVLSNNCLQKRFDKINNTNLDFCVFTLATFHNKIGDDKGLWIPNSKLPLIDFLQHKLPWQTMQPIWNKSFLLKLGGFDEQFQRLQDVDLHTRALLFPEVKYATEADIIDCYYRIDEERKNFDVFDFLQRRIVSSNMYCYKFYHLLKDPSLKKYLYVTFYKTYLQLLHQYRSKTIDKQQFSDLKQKLFALQSPKLSYFHKSLCVLGSFFSCLPLRIPGVNWAISQLIKL